MPIFDLNPTSEVLKAVLKDALAWGFCSRWSEPHLTPCDRLQAVSEDRCEALLKEDCNYKKLNLL